VRHSGKRDDSAAAADAASPSRSNSPNTVDLGRYYAILPSNGAYSVEEYCARHGGKRVEPGFSYNSGSNPEFLTPQQLKTLIDEHVIGQTID